MIHTAEAVKDRLCNQLCIRYHGDMFMSGYSEHVTIC
jgi:hypothetical protein